MLHKVELPYPNKYIFQFDKSQPVSSTADYLQKNILANYQLPILEVLELGCGCGIISIMLSLVQKQWHVMGIDIEPAFINLAILNNQLCRTSCSFIESDLRDLSKSLYNRFDLVLSNPPWQKKGSGHLSPNRLRAISRHEILCTMEDVLSACQLSIKPDGKVWLVYPTIRKEDLFMATKNSLLDIIDILEPTDSNDYFISILKNRG